MSEVCEELLHTKSQRAGIMKLVFNIAKLPELQRLDASRRREAIVDWRIALWKSWSNYFIEIGSFMAALVFFNWLWHLVAGNVLPRYADFVWILPAVITATVLRNYLIFLPRRDVLAKILQKPEYAS